MKRELIALLGAVGIGALACTHLERVTGKDGTSTAPLLIQSEANPAAAVDTLTVGDKSSLIVAGADAAAAITWTVSDSGVVRIVEQHGPQVWVAAVRPGNARITATRGRDSGNLGVFVRDETTMEP